MTTPRRLASAARNRGKKESPDVGPGRLAYWQAVATIASSIAIPIVLAVFGYIIQKEVADAGIRKDYVAIAVSILKEDPKAQEPDLRRWATTILESNSPLPFSEKARAGLEKGAIRFIAVPPPRAPEPIAECMRAPSPSRIRPLFEKLAKREAPSDWATLSAEHKALWDTALREGQEADLDRAALKCMQDYGRLVRWFNQRSTELNPVSSDIREQATPTR